jgi:hypothetical protein
MSGRIPQVLKTKRQINHASCFCVPAFQAARIFKTISSNITTIPKEIRRINRTKSIEEKKVIKAELSQKNRLSFRSSAEKISIIKRKEIKQMSPLGYTKANRKIKKKDI